MKKKIIRIIISMLLLMGGLRISVSAANISFEEEFSGGQMFTLFVDDGYKKASYPVSMWDYMGHKYQKNILIDQRSTSCSFTLESTFFPNDFYLYDQTIEIKKDSVPYRVTGEGGEWIDFQIMKVKNPIINRISISPSSKEFNPGDKNRAFINVPIKSNYPVSTYITICNSKGKEVYKKNLGKTITNVYTFVWNGKPSKDNQAGWNTNTYVPKGTYKIVVDCKGKYGANELSSKKEAEIKVGGSVRSAKYGNDQKNMVPILSGIGSIDYMAEDVCKQIIKENMTNEEKIKAIYKWIITNCRHEHDFTDSKYKPKYNLEKLENKIQGLQKKNEELYNQGKAAYSFTVNSFTAEPALLYRIGVCDHIAEIFKILANHAGFECEVVVGNYLNRNGTKSPHAWNYIRLNGTYYWMDVDVELQNWYRNGKGSIPYYWYLMTYQECLSNHSWKVDEYPK